MFMIREDRLTHTHTHTHTRIQTNISHDAPLDLVHLESAQCTRMGRKAIGYVFSSSAGRLGWYSCRLEYRSETGIVLWGRVRACLTGGREEATVIIMFEAQKEPLNFKALFGQNDRPHPQL